MSVHAQLVPLQPIPPCAQRYVDLVQAGMRFRPAKDGLPAHRERIPLAHFLQVASETLSDLEGGLERRDVQPQPLPSGQLRPWLTAVSPPLRQARPSPQAPPAAAAQLPAGGGPTALTPPPLVLLPPVQ